MPPTATYLMSRHLAAIALLSPAMAFPISATSAQSPGEAVERAYATATATFPGFCSAVVDRHGTRFIRASGFADVASRQPYTDSTVQPVGSISKTVIGVLLARAAGTGALQLDAPVSPRLPFPVGPAAGPGGTITLRHLATHTSGIRDGEAAYARAYVTLPSQDTGFTRYLRDYLSPDGALYRAEHIAPGVAGRHFVYSNVGAALAARTLESVSGAAFSELATREIFAPLGMRHTRFTHAPVTGDATLYEASGAAVRPYALVTYPDGGMRTSCADLARYLTAVLAAWHGTSERLMPQASARAMLAPQFSAATMPTGVEEREPNQGLFWQVRKAGGIGHSGSDPGVTGFVLLNPEAGTGRLFITNVGFGNAGDPPRFVQAFTALWRALAAEEAQFSKP